MSKLKETNEVLDFALNKNWIYPIENDHVKIVLLMDIAKSFAILVDHFTEEKSD